MVKIQIARLPNNIIASSLDLTDIQSRGELSHILAELELVKSKILAKWAKMGDR
jgi:hypothetical protein